MNKKDRKTFFNLLFILIAVLFYFLVLNKEIVWGSCAQSISACIGTAGGSCSFTCSNGGTCNGTCQLGSGGKANGVCSSFSDCVTPTPVVTPGCGGSAGSCSGACSKTGQSCIPTYFSEGTFFSCQCCSDPRTSSESSYCPTSTPSPSPTPAPSTPTPIPTATPPPPTPGCEGPTGTGLPACYDRPNCPSGTFCAEVGYACACITPSPTPTPSPSPTSPPVGCTDSISLSTVPCDERTGCSFVCRPNSDGTACACKQSCFDILVPANCGLGFCFGGDKFGGCVARLNPTPGQSACCCPPDASCKFTLPSSSDPSP